ncbi:MAG: helix-turn-helix domain-containing protein [Bacteroidetes bacterium]|nr:helix-turn-helix domain-containing protein [Bacteroidota bacterium]
MPKIKKSDIYYYRKERIIELYQSGLNISQIMEQFPDITYGKISDFLKESNLLPSTKSLK